MPDVLIQLLDNPFQFLILLSERIESGMKFFLSFSQFFNGKLHLIIRTAMAINF